MNLGDYDQFIIRKHQLAIALAVIKTKPDNITYETYIESIRNKIIPRNMDSNLDIVICDEDFNISDDFTQCDDQVMAGDDQIDGDELNDSVNILNNVDLNDPFKGNSDANSLLDAITQISNIEENPQNLLNNSDIEITQSTHFDETLIPSNDLTKKTHEVIDNVNNKISVENSNNIDTQQTIIYTLCGYTDDTHVSQSQENYDIPNKLVSKSSTATNHQAINQNYNINRQMRKDKLTNTILYPNETYKSKNQYCEEDFQNYYDNIKKHDENRITVNNTIPRQEFIHSLSTNNTNKTDINEITIRNTAGQGKHKNVESDIQNDIKRIKNNEKKNDSNRLEMMEFSENPTIINSLEININENADAAVNYKNNDSNRFDNNYDNYLTQDFMFLDSDSNTPNIDQSGLIGFDKKASDDTEQQFSPQDSPNLLLPNVFNNTLFKSTIDANDKRILNNSTCCFKNEINEKNNMVMDGDVSDNLSQNSRSKSNYKPNEMTFENKRNKVTTNKNNKIEKGNNEEYSNHINVESKCTSNVKEINCLKECVLNNLPNDEIRNETKEMPINDNTQMVVEEQNNSSDNETDAQVEIVPFKVLEDLNKIKCYLNRSERRLSQGINSLDSGFRSSQARSSYKSASQHSEIWYNESAHSLLTFLADSQLSDKTAVIADEISRILGRLVDKLHEQEKYPVFLEEFLEKVNILLNDIYEGNNLEPNVLIKRDDTIYRLLLLNRSSHIIKYTIDKIIVILENTFSNIKEDILELKHTDITENICYIFHVLEVILKRAKKSNDSSQMSVQNSNDDDKVLKKSSLTEIWRRKWNLAKIENVKGSSKKKCVLTKCSEVLNRIIVQAMDGYSLISFAALQCFNLLQTK